MRCGQNINTRQDASMIRRLMMWSGKVWNTPGPCINIKMVFPGMGIPIILQWHHNEHDGASNHQPHDCLLNRLFRRRSKKTSKLRVTGFVRGIHRWPVNSPAQGASNAENVSIWWRHHVTIRQPWENFILNMGIALLVREQLFIVMALMSGDWWITLRKGQ